MLRFGSSDRLGPNLTQIHYFFLFLGVYFPFSLSCISFQMSVGYIATIWVGEEHMYYHLVEGIRRDILSIKSLMIRCRQFYNSCNLVYSVYLLWSISSTSFCIDSNQVILFRWCYVANFWMNLWCCALVSLKSFNSYCSMLYIYTYS